MVILLFFAFLCLLFFVVRLLYDRYWERGLSCKLSFCDEYAVEGNTAALREVLVNGKLLPLPAVEIDFHLDRRLQFADGQNASLSDQTYRRDVFALSARQKITRTLEFKCAGRGYFQISQAGVTGKDLFFTRKYLTSRLQHTEFYVLPAPAPSGQIAIPFSRVMGAVLSRRKLYDDPFEFAGLREYSRGDPMKYINWKATARAGELLTNLHESTLSQRVVVLLDMEGAGVQHADWLNEAAVRIACSLCERLLAAGVELDLYSNGKDVLTGDPWKMERVSGAGSLLALKKKFACVQAGNGLTPVCACLPEEAFDLAGGIGEEKILVLISRSQEQESADAFSRAVGKGKGVVIAPFQVRHEEVEVPRNCEMVWMEV